MRNESWIEEQAEDGPPAGAYWSSDGLVGVAVRVKGAVSSGHWLVAEMTPDEMVEMAEHLLVNARRKQARINANDDRSRELPHADASTDATEFIARSDEA